MDKPDITNGEWVSLDRWIVCREDDKTTSGVICSTRGSNDNARAISAVPEMIEALMCFVKSKAGPNDCAQKAKEALEKAGVELSD